MSIKESVKEFGKKHKATIIAGLTGAVAGGTGFVIGKILGGTGNNCNDHHDKSLDNADIIASIAMMDMLDNDLDKYQEKLSAAKEKFTNGPINEEEDYTIGLALAKLYDITKNKCEKEEVAA